MRLRLSFYAVFLSVAAFAKEPAKHLVGSDGKAPVTYIDSRSQRRQVECFNLQTAAGAASDSIRKNQPFDAVLTDVKFIDDTTVSDEWLRRKGSQILTADKDMLTTALPLVKQDGCKSVEVNGLLFNVVESGPHHLELRPDPDSISKNISKRLKETKDDSLVGFLLKSSPQVVSSLADSWGKDLELRVEDRGTGRYALTFRRTTSAMGEVHHISTETMVTVGDAPADYKISKNTLDLQQRYLRLQNPDQESTK